MSEPADTVKSNDEERIRAAALDYVEGWCTGDPLRMERALHPDLVKRAYLPGPNGKGTLSHLSALALVQFARQSKDSSEGVRVELLDRFEGVASVRVTMAKWVDYMHLVWTEGQWRIINILWELTPEQWIARGGTAEARTPR